MAMLTEGVPADTIAVIDDSGGTLTAPILGDFKGVVCMGGTIRSHLGILTREYGVPCLMAAKLDGAHRRRPRHRQYSSPADAADASASVSAPASSRSPRGI